MITEEQLDTLRETIRKGGEVWVKVESNTVGAHSPMVKMDPRSATILRAGDIVKVHQIGSLYHDCTKGRKLYYKWYADCLNYVVSTEVVIAEIQPTASEKVCTCNVWVAGCTCGVFAAEMAAKEGVS